MNVYSRLWRVNPWEPPFSLEFNIKDISWELGRMLLESYFTGSVFLALVVMDFMLGAIGKCICVSIG